MKRFFCGLITFSAMLAGFVSCDNATNTTEGYYEGIFTINGKRVIPELTDTFYIVNETMGLDDGDRALMRLNYFIDNAYGTAAAKWSIGTVYEKNQVDDIVSAQSVSPDEYTSAISGIYEGYYGAAWAWLKYQNLNIVYKSDGSEPLFKMVADNFENDTLYLSLHAKITNGDNTNQKLLCYDITSALRWLDSDKQAEMLTADTLNTKIMMKYYDQEEETVKEGTIIGGKAVNPFKNL